MATFIPGITDTITATTPYSPDFNFINAMMQRKSMQYEEGFAKVSNAYNSVLNAPLSNKNNLPVRDQYVKQADEKLKDLANVDLSKLENQDIAGDVYSNFWNDELILKDMSLTKSLQSELQRAYSLRDSDDPEMRSQFSMTAVQYLMNDMETLQNAERTPEGFAQVQGRKFVPFKNEKEYFTKMAKEQGMDVKFDEVRGNFIVTREGMEPQELQKWALAQVDSGLRDQYHIMGIVAKEGQMKSIMAQFPGISKSDAQAMVVEKNVSRIRQGLDTQIKDQESTISQIDTMLKEYEKIGMLNPAQAAQVAGLSEQRKAVEGNITRIKDQYGNDLEESFKNDPDRYFAMDAQTVSTQTWANAWAASHRSVTIKDNSPFDMAMKQNEYELSLRKQSYDEMDGDRKYALDREKLAAGANGTGGGTGLDANGNPVDTGVFNGRGTTSVQHVGTAVDVFHTEQAQFIQTVAHHGTDPSRMGYFATKLPGVTEEEGVAFLSELEKQYLDPRYKVPAERRAAFKKVDDALRASTGMDIKGPNTRMQAMAKYAEIYVDGLTKDGGPGLTQEVLTALNGAQMYEDAQRKVVARQNAFNNAESAALLSSNDEEMKRLIVQDPDGKRRLMNSKDMSSNLKAKKYEIATAVGGSKKTYTSEEISRLYMDGKIDVVNSTFGPALQINGARSYQLNAQGGAITSGALISEIQGLQSKYGSSEKMKQVKEKAKEDISRHLPQEFADRTGRIGVNTAYDITTGMGQHLVNNLSNPANVDSIYINGGPSGTEDAGMLRAVMGLGAEHSKKFISNVVHKPVGVNGKRSIEVVFAPISPENKNALAGYNLGAISGKTVEFVLSDNASGSGINALKKGADFQLYSEISEGKTMRSSALMQKAGFDFTVQPNRTSDPTSATITIQRYGHDAKGNRVRLAQERIPIDLIGSKAKSNDEIMAFIYGLYSGHLAESDAKARTKTPAEGLVPYNDVINTTK